ncbi:MAG: LysR substrate-binding domain-containing protein [Kofleriaceae bacterium]
MPAPSRPSVRQLECVVAVAEHRNFRRAAAAVGVSQPALSIQIQQLERRLGVQLFERDRRAVLVTAAGEEVVAQARLALGAVDEVAAAARRLGEPLVGPLRMGVIPTVAPYLLPAVLPAVRKRFPRLELILREEQTHRLLAGLAAGQLDCALLALPVPGDLTAATVVREEFLLAAPRGDALLRRRGSVREADLAGHEVLLLEDGHCLRDQALAVCSEAGAAESAGLRATSLPTLVQMVAGGLGVTLLPAAAAAVLAPASGPVAVAEFAAPAPGRTIGLVWRTSSARLRESWMLAEELRTAATPYLAGLRSRRRR